MALLVSARNALLFLAGWEVMALAAFLLITTVDQDKEVREVGYIYLVATRIGTLCLFAMFAALFSLRGDWNLEGPLDAHRALAVAVFVLGFIGFGLKAGIMPLHVWLPGAHANAPSHVSAIMSGVLIKTGIYGIVRITSLFPSPPAWWGGVVLGFGVASGVLGVAFAIGQHDLKRLLAYHSVENIGIICMGIGLALLGRALGRPDWWCSASPGRSCTSGTTACSRRSCSSRPAPSSTRPARARSTASAGCQSRCRGPGSRSCSARRPSAGCRRSTASSASSSSTSGSSGRPPRALGDSGSPQPCQPRASRSSARSRSPAS